MDYARFYGNTLGFKAVSGFLLFVIQRCLHFLVTELNFIPQVSLQFLRGSEWGYLDNTKHFIFWLCNMKQLNFRHFNTNSEKILETLSSFQRSKNGSRMANIILFSISSTFWPFYDNLFPKATEGSRRLPKSNGKVRPLPKKS